MAYPDYKKDLLADDFDANYVLDRYFHSGQSHVFTGANPSEEVDLLNEITTNLYKGFRTRVHPMQVIVCGSAHLGFSPVPEKIGTPFNSEKSDIDVAVISPEIFEMTWNELISAGLDPALRQTISRDLFWGFINPAHIHSVSTQGELWWNAFGSIKTDRAKGVRGRLYRSFWSMQSYHRIAVFQGRERLLAEQQNQ